MVVKRYRHLFFDLDHTLWDFRTNSRAVLHALYLELDLAGHGIPDAPALIEVYEEINAGLWQRMERGLLDKEVMRVLRFRNTLLRFGVRDARLAASLGDLYLERTPRMSGLFPGTLELLRELLPEGAAPSDLVFAATGVDPLSWTVFDLPFMRLCSSGTSRS